MTVTKPQNPELYSKFLFCYQIYGRFKEVNTSFYNLHSTTQQFLLCALPALPNKKKSKPKSSNKVTFYLYT